MTPTIALFLIIAGCLALAGLIILAVCFVGRNTPKVEVEVTHSDEPTLFI